MANPPTQSNVDKTKTGNTSSNLGAGLKKPNKKRSMPKLNILLGIAIIIVITLFGWAEMQRRTTKSQLFELSAELEQLRNTSEQTPEQRSAQIIDRVRALIDLPTDPRPSVATIIDIETLKEANPFYTNAQNGDHLIITKDRAVLFSAERNVIIDVVPVTIQEPNESPANSPTPSPSQPATGTQTQPTAETQESEIETNQ